uniref:Uncharacterized protein n=1 Tax=Bactrocera latifrons TaxID=174628 RepID=A0A0K8VER3_BACLA
MGGVQSSRRASYPQTPLVQYRCIEEPLGISSTFNGITRGAVPPATIKIAPFNPPQKRQKHDATNSIRNPLTFLTISEDNAAPQKMIDVVRSTSKGFPSFSELRESMRRKKVVKRREGNENLEMGSLRKPKCNRNSEDIFLDLGVPTLPTKKDETAESGFHTPLNHHDFNFSNENLFEYIDDDIGKDLYQSEETDSQLSYYSDSSDTSESLKNLSYDMRKDYYYL